MLKLIVDYITKEGRLVLEKELDHLWRVERPMVTQAVSEAAALGDRSENAEYIYGKKRLREIDRRIRFLVKRLKVLRVVEPHPQQEGRIYFGAWVKLADLHNEKEVIFRLVGSDEFDLKKGYISINSPMARALLGKYVGDDVMIETPNGHHYYSILEIIYNNSFTN